MEIKVREMSQEAFLKFANEAGILKIRIAVSEFCCIGALPPQDHPHIYLDMGELDSIVCPYCSTVFRLDPGLGPEESDPPACLFDEKATED